MFFQEFKMSITLHDVQAIQGKFAQLFTQVNNPSENLLTLVKEISTRVHILLTKKPEIAAANRLNDLSKKLKFLQENIQNSGPLIHEMTVNVLALTSLISSEKTAVVIPLSDELVPVNGKAIRGHPLFPRSGPLLQRLVENVKSGHYGESVKRIIASSSNSSELPLVKLLILHLLATNKNLDSVDCFPINEETTYLFMVLQIQSYELKQMIKPLLERRVDHNDLNRLCRRSLLTPYDLLIMSSQVTMESLSNGSSLAPQSPLNCP